MVAIDPLSAQITAGTAMAIAKATLTAFGVAVATGGVASIVTVFVVKGLTGHQLYETHEQMVKTGGSLGLGIVSVYAISLVTIEWAARGRTELVVVLLLALLAGVAFVARPAFSSDRAHSVGRPTLVTITVLVFVIVFLLALLFAYPFVQDVVNVLATLL